MVAYKKSIKRFVEKTNVYFDKSIEEFAARIQEREEKLIKLKSTFEL